MKYIYSTFDIAGAWQSLVKVYFHYMEKQQYEHSAEYLSQKVSERSGETS